MDGPPDELTTLKAYPWVVIRFRCHYCARSADARLAVYAALLGPHATLGDLLARFVEDCPWDPASPLRKPRKYGHKCGAYCPDVGRSGPPDLPPGMTRLRLIEGGKGDLLPVRPTRRPTRKRIGGPEE